MVDVLQFGLRSCGVTGGIITHVLPVWDDAPRSRGADGLRDRPHETCRQQNESPETAEFGLTDEWRTKTSRRRVASRVEAQRQTPELSSVQ